MAPNASLIDLRVLDRNGESLDSEVIAAIDWAIQLKAKYNIRVINLSLGRAVSESYKQDPLCQVVEAAWKAGIVVVVAAGNDGRDNSVGEHGYGTVNAPGNDPSVVTVGAMKAMGTYSRTDDLIASYSSKGPSLFDNVVKPDLVAPGNGIVSVRASGTSTLVTEFPGNPFPSQSYFLLNGTSMAAAAVSGAVADLLQAQPNLTPDQVKARLMLTAYKTFPQFSTATDPVTGAAYVSCYDLFTVGAGYLDLQAALTNSYVSAGNSLSPTAAFNPGAGAIWLNFDPASAIAPYGAQGVLAGWGAAATLGSNGVAGSSSIWSTGTSSGVSSISSTSSDEDDIMSNGQN
jgi:serine protease AprX